MPETFVRVRQAVTRHELSVARSHFNAAPVGAYEVIDKPATFPAGDPLPPKYRRTVAQAATHKATTRKRAAEHKEEAPDVTPTTEQENN